MSSQSHSPSPSHHERSVSGAPIDAVKSRSFYTYGDLPLVPPKRHAIGKTRQGSVGSMYEDEGISDNSISDFDMSSSDGECAFILSTNT
jgi:uncharacterized membrane protein